MDGLRGWWAIWRSSEAEGIVVAAAVVGVWGFFLGEDADDVRLMESQMLQDL